MEEFEAEGRAGVGRRRRARTGTSVEAGQALAAPSKTPPRACRTFARDLSTEAEAVAAASEQALASAQPFRPPPSR